MTPETCPSGQSLNTENLDTDVGLYYILLNKSLPNGSNDVLIEASKDPQ
jgi:hypothetical protein